MHRCDIYDDLPDVAPFTGAWIEIMIEDYQWLAVRVAPFTGAWIEITRL